MQQCQTKKCIPLNLYCDGPDFSSFNIYFQNKTYFLFDGRNGKSKINELKVLIEKSHGDDWNL